MVAERGLFSFRPLNETNEASMATAEETLLVPQNYDQAEEFVNKLMTIEDLRAFCCMFGLLQDGTKASLKGRLLEHYKGQFKALSGTPVPTQRKKSRAISPQSTDEEPLFPSAAVDVEQSIDKLHGTCRFANERVHGRVAFAVQYFFNGVH